MSGSVNDQVSSDIAAVHQENIEEGYHSDRLVWFYRHLPEIFGNQTMIAFNVFRKIHTTEYAKHLFQLFDLDNNRRLSIQELLGGFKKMNVCTGHNLELNEMTRVVFIYADKKSQQINRSGFRRMLQDDSRSMFGLFKRGLTDSAIAASDFFNGLENLARMMTDEKYLMWLFKVLKDIAPLNNVIQLKDFRKVLNAKQEFLSNRIFYSITNGAEQISLVDLLENLEHVFLGPEENKLAFLFKVYDLDGDGTVSKDELQQILSSCLEESTVVYTQLTVHSLTNIMWETIVGNTVVDNDQGNGSGSHGDKDCVTFEEFRNGLSTYPELVENLSISASTIIRRGSGDEQCQKKIKISWQHQICNYFKNNLSITICTLVLLVINIILGLEAGSRYWHKSNGFVVVARICGQLLNFNDVIILIFVCRQLLAYLRETPISYYLPIDKSYIFHINIGITIVVLALIHTIMHLCNFGLLVSAAQRGDPGVPNFTYFEWVLTTRPGVGWVNGSAAITGWILWILLLTISLFSLPIVRKRGHFQMFYISHQLFYLYEITMILHGPNFWKWLLAPAVLYAIDQFLRFGWVNRIRFGKTIVRRAKIHPSRVVCLYINRPPSWTFRAGDYMLVKIPEVAKFEWHPFTISSPPEQKEVISLHIRAVGHWTNRLYELVKERASLPGHRDLPAIPMDVSQYGLPASPQKPASHPLRRLVHWHQSVVEPEPEQDLSTDGILKSVYINGPFGRASGQIFRAHHAVLICTGIGVTPFSSVLQAIFHRYINQCFVCPNCETTCFQDPANAFSLKKVDFFWINHSHNAFEWFTEILRGLEESALIGYEGKQALIDVHLFMTGAPSASDIKAVALKVALDMAYKKLHKDVLSGLHSRIEAGRPDWRKEFEIIRAANKGKVTVFYCGIPMMKHELKTLSKIFDFEFCEEVF